MTPNSFFGISRTTLNGFLVPIMIACGAVTSYQFASVQAPHWWVWVVASAGLLSAIIHAIVAQGQGDAPANPPTTPSK